MAAISQVPPDARKALGIAFTILTFIINVILLVKYKRGRQQIGELQAPLYLMKLSMIFAGIILSTSYLIEVFIIFNQSVTCGTAFMVFKYEREIFPFVFGILLVLHGIYLKNLVQKHQPWLYWWFLHIISLVFILPFVLVGSGTSSRQCFLNADWTKARWISVEVIYGILPGCLAFIISLIIFLKNLRHVQVLEPTGENFNLQTISTVSTSTIHPESTPTNVMYQPSNYNQQSTQYYGPAEYPRPQNYDEREFINGYLQQYNGESHRQSVPAQPSPRQEDASTVNVNTDADTNKPKEVINSRKLLTTYFMASFVFMLSVAPYSIYFIHTYGKEYTSQDLTLLESFNWAKHLYPVLVPLIWLRDL